MRSIIFILTLFVVCTTCKKDNALVYSSSLFGEWSWISSCGGIAGNCYTPKSTNEKINLVFSADSLISSFINDTLRLSERFSVSKMVSQETGDTTNVIKYASRSQMFHILHDTLFLDDFCCDQYYSTYKRFR
jgi:hypothetical protein